MLNKRLIGLLALVVVVILVVVAGVLFLPRPNLDPEGAVEAINRIFSRDASSGFYETYEVKPSGRKPTINIPGVRGGGRFSYSPVGATVRSRSRLTDSHQGLRFYISRKCIDCHPQEAKDLHTVRASLNCRQCHGYEPISGLDSFYSPFNPVRKHAYVCSKCHEGANASFASYVIHEPLAYTKKARQEFPILYYVHWGMFFLLTGTLAAFIPHALLLGLRGLTAKKGKKGKKQK